MVKAELSITIKDDKLRISLDLLKREDWTEEEWELANSLQNSLLVLIEVLKQNERAGKIDTEIITGESSKR